MFSVVLFWPHRSSICVRIPQKEGSMPRPSRERHRWPRPAASERVSRQRRRRPWGDDCRSGAVCLCMIATATTVVAARGTPRSTGRLSSPQPELSSQPRGRCQPLQSKIQNGPDIVQQAGSVADALSGAGRAFCKYVCPDAGTTNCGPSRYM